MKIRSYSAPVYRPDAPEFRGRDPGNCRAKLGQTPSSEWFAKGKRHETKH